MDLGYCKGPEDFVWLYTYAYFIRVYYVCTTYLRRHYHVCESSPYIRFTHTPISPLTPITYLKNQINSILSKNYIPI